MKLNITPDSAHIFSVPLVSRQIRFELDPGRLQNKVVASLYQNFQLYCTYFNDL